MERIKEIIKEKLSKARLALLDYKKEISSEEEALDFIDGYQKHKTTIRLCRYFLRKIKEFEDKDES